MHINDETFDFHVVNDYPPEREAHDAAVCIDEVLKDFGLDDEEVILLTDAALLLKRLANEHS